MRHLLFFFVLLIAQTNILTLQASTTQLDSLIKSLDHTQEFEERGQRLLEIVKLIKHTDPDQALVYANEAKSLVPKIGSFEYEIEVLLAFSAVNITLWQADEALSYGLSAVQLAKRTDNKEALQRAYTNNGIAHYINGDLLKAMQNYEEGLQVFEKQNQNISTARILGNMGNILHQQDKNERALFFYQEALDLYTKFADSRGIAICQINIGAQFGSLGRHQEALDSFFEALKIFKESGIEHDEIGILMNIAHHSAKLGDIEQSRAFYNKAVVISDNLEDNISKGRILYNLAIIAKDYDDCSEAIDYAEECIKLTESAKTNHWTLDAFKILFDCYEVQGNYQKAFEFKKRYHASRDSVFNQEQEEKMLEFSTKYEAEKKELENKLLKKEKEESMSIIKQQKTIGWLSGVSLVLLITVLGFLYRNYINKSRYSQKLEKEVANRTGELEQLNKELQESNIELERFAYIASHDLKEPIRNIINFTDVLNIGLNKNSIDIPEISECTSIISDNAKRMNLLIEEVLEYSQVGNPDRDVQKVFVDEILDQVLVSISSTLEEKNASVNVADLPKAKSNQNYLSVVLKNLIENGIKYNDKVKKEIVVSGKLKDDKYEISVSDNGIGIDEQYFDHIFNMFERLHNRKDYDGTGLGLSICKKIVNQLGGEISLTSKKGKGSTFTFDFLVSD